jgi:hypothetical protein
MLSRFLLVVIALAILAGAGDAVTNMVVSTPRDSFRTMSFEFDLAPGWWCASVGGEYICAPQGPFPRAAIAMIAIKNRGDQDSLRAYEEDLSHPRTPTGDAERVGELARVQYVKRRILGSAEWVEALHTGSEVSNYDTYYLETVTSTAGIVVIMSVHKHHEPTYIKQLSKMMSTLNVH